MGMLALRVKITKFEVKSTTTSRNKIPITLFLILTLTLLKAVSLEMLSTFAVWMLTF